MTNVIVSVSGDVMHIQVNLKESAGVSKSGKSELIASSEGNYTVPGTNGVKVGLNVYEPVAR